MAETMAAGSGKGVGIRLFVAGGELVKKTFNEIRDSGNRMWSEVASGARPVNPAMRAISAASVEVQGAFQGLAARAGTVGAVLTSIGPWGLAAAAALGAVAIAAGRAMEAMAFADELTDTSRQLGVGAEALQAYRFAAEELDSTAAALDSSLGGLNKALGAIKSGVGDERVLEAFKALGFTPEQLRSYDTAAELLPVVADRMRDVGNVAENAKLASKLGIDESLVPALMRGGDAFNDAADKARAFGLVMSDDVRVRLDEANRSIEVAKQRIGMDLRLAFADVAPLVSAAAEEIRIFVHWLAQAGKAVGEFMRMRNQLHGSNLLPSAAGSPPPSGLGGLAGLGVVPTPTIRAPAPSGSARGGRRSGSSGSSSRSRTQPLDRIDFVSIEDIENARLQIALETARIQKNEQLVAQLEREADVRALIAKYIKMGMSDDQARAAADIEESRRDVGRLGAINDFEDTYMQSATVQLAQAEQDRIAAARESFGQALVLAFQDREKFMADIMARVFDNAAQRLGEVLFDILSQVAGQMGQGGTSGGANWMATVVSSLFGGSSRRAAGGGLESGRRYSYAEDGRGELAMLSGSGHVYSHDETARMIREAVGGAGGGPWGERRSPAVIQMTVKLDGATTDREIRAVVAQGMFAAVGEAKRQVMAEMPNWQVESNLLSN